MSQNSGCPLDLGWINSVAVEASHVYGIKSEITEQCNKLSGTNKAAWLLKAVSCLDLTTLSGDDTRSNVVRLTRKALNPISSKILEELHFDLKPFKTAAVCVYPDRVKDVADVLSNVKPEKQIPIAAVGYDFPSGQCGTVYRNVMECIEMGATEIDLVIKRSWALTGSWELLYRELQAIKAKVQDKAKLKTILSVGELGNFRNIYKASLVAMMAGSDFIKTSTGKEAINATLPIGLVMMRAIRDYYMETGKKVGFKAAGGIRTSNDALNWLALTKRELGTDWLNQSLFRIGASELLKDLERELYILAFNRGPAENSFTLA